MADASKTLETILKIITKDVGHIKKKSHAQLDPDDAQTLARYASTLNNIIEEEYLAKEKAKKKFEKMPTEDLVKFWIQEKQKTEQRK